MALNTQPIIPMANLFSLAGKTSIVTGGTGGLGSAMLMALAEGGSDIISIQHPNEPDDFAKEVQSLGRKVAIYKCDLSNSKNIRATLAKVWQDGHVPDVLVNAAGIQRRGSILELDDDAIDAVIQVNLKATYIMAQEVGRQMINLQRPGKIINIASVIAHVGNMNAAPYAASKGGVLQMSKSFSNEWASKGIQVNCISPGYVKTELTRVKWTNKEHHDTMVARIPAGRWAETSDFRGAIVFLASAASNYVTGTSIAVDGGFLGR